MNELSDLIKNKRIAAGMTVHGLAQKCGLSDTAISRLEAGKIDNPKWENLCSIAKVLDIHTFEILLAAGYISESDIRPSGRLHRIDDLSQSELDEVQSFIDYLHYRKTRNPEGGLS